MPSQGENYYDDGPANAAPDGGGAAEAKEGDEGGETSILPKTFFPAEGLKPGYKCDVEVVAVHEDSVEVKPCKEGDDHKEGGEMESPAPDPGEMSSMME